MELGVFPLLLQHSKPEPMDILITEEFDSPAIDKLAEKYSVVRQPDVWKKPDALKEAVAVTRTIIVRNQTQLTGDILRNSLNLIAIGRNGVGLDNIDVEAANEKGIVVIAPLEANAVSVAELTLGFLLSLARKIPAADRDTHGGGWNRKGFTGLELDGKTLAICGFGRIGRMVAKRAYAFGLHIVVFDPYVQGTEPTLRECNASVCSQIDDAVVNADFVTAHMPLTPETRSCFNMPRFSSMKKGAFFINTSRGGLVDETALADALESGHLGGAALDVRQEEPPATRGRLEKLDNVVLTPHIGAFTTEAQQRTTEAVCDDIDRLLSGGEAKNSVNFAKPKR